MDFTSPVGRIVQGSVVMTHQKDMDTNQPLFNPDGTPEMGIFFALAFPKVLPNGQRNGEFDQFWSVLAGTAAAAWPALFPQGAPQYVEYIKQGQTGASTHPRFSYKYQDGDGVNQSGKSVATHAGFAGHHIVKFYTAYPVRAYYEGKFAPHEEIQTPAEIFKRGYWMRVVGEVKSNNATGTQVPGISIYPKLLSFIARGEEIVSGPDAQTAFGAAPVGWTPPVTDSPIPSGVNVPPVGGVPNVAVPAVNVPAVSVPAVNVPAVNVPAVSVPTPAVNVPVPTPAAPTYVVSPALAAQGVTMDMLLGQGWTHESAVANGHATRVG